MVNPRKHAAILAPSLLAGDHAALAHSMAQVAAAGLHWLHLDIMDGHFVPNLSFGPETLAALRRSEKKNSNRPPLPSTPLVGEVPKNESKTPAPPLFFDTHLMLAEPRRYTKAFAEAGADLISIHIEPDYDHAAALREIRALGCQSGIVLNPDTPPDAIRHLLGEVDLILVMTVQPGFGGQAFRPEMLEKLQVLDRWRHENGWQWRLEVDGGIDLPQAAQCRAAGADTFVAGTAFFKAPDLAAFARTIESF